MSDETTGQKSAAEAVGQNECLVSHCQKCGDRLTGHEDEGKSLCRWCVTGWTETPSAANMVYNENGELVYC